MIKGRESKEPHDRFYYAWYRFKKNKLALSAFIFIIIITCLAVFAPLIAITGYEDQEFLDKSLSLPDSENWFGVDAVGRDYFTRVIYGTRVSLGIGLMAALAAVAIGVPVGALAGYFGSKVDWFVMRVIEVMSVIPPLLIGIVLATVTGGGVGSIITIAAAFYWVYVARLVRGQVMSLRNQEYVMAAVALGAKTPHIIFKHVIPNTVAQIIVGLVLMLPQAIMLEASLSFLGVGVHPPLPSWGQMISDGLYYIFYYWHLPVIPALFLAVTILSISVVGDGLRDALDPKLKGR
jgi:ABC-type dipeptide/oligopeptide/nickel transport system permease subunit